MYVFIPDFYTDWKSQRRWSASTLTQYRASAEIKESQINLSAGTDLKTMFLTKGISLASS